MPGADSQPLTVVGLDPGLANLGLGAVREEGRETRWLGSRLVVTPSRQSAAERLGTIYREVEEFLACHRPDAVAIEGQFFHRQRDTAFKVGQAVGVVLLAAQKYGAPVHEYGPMEVKQTLVGTGRASKQQVEFMVRSLLSLPAVPESHHVADALALALTHLSFRRLKSRVVPGRSAG